MTDPREQPVAPDSAERSTLDSQQVALLGIVANAVLAGVKLATGIIGHSFALIADAIESIGDIAGSIVVWGGLRYGAQPPDEDHPFGHGKAEALAALAVAVLIVGAGIGIGIHALREIHRPHEAPRSFTIVVLIAVILIKESLYRLANRASIASGSNAGRADAWHHRSDAITSLAALIGISVALVGGDNWAVADDWAALFAGCVIVANGVLISRGPFDELMDRSAPEIERVCTRTVLSINGFTGVERCNARKSGRIYRVVMHADVSPDMTVAEAHALTGIAKAAVRRAQPLVASLLIHIEPTRDAIPSPPVDSSSPD
ncbi:MAG: cation transporter [Phycisphaeraceae bacterium]|nr:cation transporter [Phycisphaeraceae bacterium]